MTENQRYWIVLMASLVVAYLGGLDSIPDGTYRLLDSFGPTP